LELNFSDINIFTGTGSRKIGSERVKSYSYVRLAVQISWCKKLQVLIVSMSERFSERMIMMMMMMMIMMS